MTDIMMVMEKMHKQVISYMFFKRRSVIMFSYPKNLVCRIVGAIFSLAYLEIDFVVPVIIATLIWYHILELIWPWKHYRQCH